MAMGCQRVISPAFAPHHLILPHHPLHGGDGGGGDDARGEGEVGHKEGRLFAMATAARLVRSAHLGPLSIGMLGRLKGLMIVVVLAGGLFNQPFLFLDLTSSKSKLVSRNTRESTNRGD
jgi:hypothetical protein